VPKCGYRVAKICELFDVITKDCSHFFIFEFALSLSGVSMCVKVGHGDLKKFLSKRCMDLKFFMSPNSAHTASSLRRLI